MFDHLNTAGEIEAIANPLIQGDAKFTDFMNGFISLLINVLFVFDLTDGGEGGTGAKVRQVVIDSTAVNRPEI